MEDLKKYLEIDKTKLSKSLENENKLGKLEQLRKENKLIINNFKTWEELFKYDENRTNLENFLLVRTAGAISWNLYKEGFDDPDCTPEALEYLKKKLEGIKEVETVKVGKDIHEEEKDRAFKITIKGGKEIYLESDTANSLLTDLGEFLRIIFKKYKKNPEDKNWAEATYIKEYDLPKNVKNNNFYKPFRNFYWYTQISKLPQILTEDEKACFDILEKRAGLTHTLNNMILVPYGYNSPRGISLKTYQSKIKINDRLDLTFQDFEEMKDVVDDEELQKRLCKGKNDKKTIQKYSKDAVRFLMNHKAELFSDIPKYPKDIPEKTIKWITEVSKEIIRTLDK